jgi:hypothetical protein
VTHVWDRSGGFGQETLDLGQVISSLIAGHNAALLEPFVRWVLDVCLDDGLDKVDNGRLGRVCILWSVAVRRAVGPGIKGGEAGLRQKVRSCWLDH